VPVGFTKSILDFRFWILDSNTISPVNLNGLAMYSLDAKLAFNLLGERQTANRNGFRPETI
jgi:hypothetical protein